YASGPTSTPSSGNYRGARLGYAHGALNVALAAGRQQDNVQPSLSLANLAATYDFGFIKPSLILAQEKRGSARIRAYQLGATAPIGPHLIRGSIGKYDVSGQQANADWIKYSVGYAYNFSKNTQIYASYAYVHNQSKLPRLPVRYPEVLLIASSKSKRDIMNPKTFRWYGVITLLIVVAISYIDRINIAVLITDQDFLRHMGMQAHDRVSQGLLATAFMVGYGVSSVVLTPFCSALLGVRRSLVIGLIFWGVVTYVSPLMHSYGLLLMSRALLGISEGPLFALAGAYIKAHFEASENGKPNSLVNMGTGLGLAIGYPFIGFLLSSHNWDNSFHILGLMNILLGIPLVLAFVRMPKVERGAAKASSAKASLQQVGQIIRGSLQTRHLFLITLLTSAFLAYLWGSSNWLPAYLKEARGFNLRDLGWIASLPQYATIVAVFIGGMIIDRLPRERVPLIFVGGATGAQHVASAFGVVNGVGSLFAGFMPAIMGWVITQFAGGNAA
uniref:MFS domain-containing protein n=1 Tax=Steinernema glaseri TaxID=37863 RepID=A0A1I8AW77_9BILA